MHLDLEKMFSGFDEASRDMTYFCVDPTWGRATAHDDSFTFFPPYFGYVNVSSMKYNCL